MSARGSSAARCARRSAAGERAETAKRLKGWRLEGSRGARGHHGTYHGSACVACLVLIWPIPTPGYFSRRALLRHFPCAPPWRGTRRPHGPRRPVASWRAGALGLWGCGCAAYMAGWKGALGERRVRWCASIPDRGDRNECGNRGREGGTRGRLSAGGVCPSAAASEALRERLRTRVRRVVVSVEMTLREAPPLPPVVGSAVKQRHASAAPEGAARDGPSSSVRRTTAEREKRGEG